MDWLQSSHLKNKNKGRREVKVEIYACWYNWIITLLKVHEHKETALSNTLLWKGHLSMSKIHLCWYFFLPYLPFKMLWSKLIDISSLNDHKITKTEGDDSPFLLFYIVHLFLPHIKNLIVPDTFRQADVVMKLSNCFWKPYWYGTKVLTDWNSL